MNTKKLLTVLFAGTLGFSTLLSPALDVEAAPSSVSEYDSLISELNSKETKLSQKLEDVQRSIQENEEEAEKLVKEMKGTETTLSELRDEIKELKQVIEQREELLQEQARSLQIVGESGNVVSFVLEAESLTDIVGRVDVVNKIITSNKQTIDKQAEDKALVEKKENETIEKQEEQMKLAGKLESNKSLLEEQKAEQESLVAQVAADKAVAQGDRQELIAQAQAAEERRKELESVRQVSAEASSSSESSSSESSSSESSSSESSSSESTNSNASSKSVATASSSKEAAPKEKSSSPAPSGNNGSVVGVANGLKGVPYQTAGGTPSGFDCSGFTSYAFNQVGRSLPRTAAGQYAGTSRVSRSQAKAGDLVFFSQGSGVDHVGIYLGGGQFIGSQSSTGVAVSTINSGYWSNYVVGFGR